MGRPRSGYWLRRNGAQPHPHPAGRPDLGYQAIGYLVDGSRENNIGLGLIPHLGSYNELEGVLQELPDLHTVFIALPGEMHQATARLLAICEKYGVRAQAVPDLLQISLHRVEFTNMGGIPMLGVREMSINRLERFLKRVLDLTILAILAVPSLLVGVVVAVAIKLDSPGPVIYSGLRVGRHGKLFKMYKFRSMVIDAEQQKEALQAFNEADGPLFKIKDDPRLTRVGRFIRRTSLDELPQLINVLQGNMSLVGPRPPLLEEVEQYKPWHRQRLTVIGGLTGLPAGQRALPNLTTDGVMPAGYLLHRKLVALAGYPPLAADHPPHVVWPGRLLIKPVPGYRQFILHLALPVDPVRQLHRGCDDDTKPSLFPTYCAPVRVCPGR
ncbi:MAG: sugar transferase [Ardenticatenaceae bacterium]|nr:sugar transferase [Ardenticatenaceae bacterium]